MGSFCLERNLFRCNEFISHELRSTLTTAVCVNRFKLFKYESKLLFLRFDETFDQTSRDTQFCEIFFDHSWFSAHVPKNQDMQDTRGKFYWTAVY